MIVSRAYFQQYTPPMVPFLSFIMTKLYFLQETWISWGHFAVGAATKYTTIQREYSEFYKYCSKAAV